MNKDYLSTGLLFLYAGVSFTDGLTNLLFAITLTVGLIIAAILPWVGIKKLKASALTFFDIKVYRHHDLLRSLVIWGLLLTCLFFFMDDVTMPYKVFNKIFFYPTIILLVVSTSIFKAAFGDCHLTTEGILLLNSNNKPVNLNKYGSYYYDPKSEGFVLTYKNTASLELIPKDSIIPYESVFIQMLDTALKDEIVPWCRFKYF